MTRSKSWQASEGLPLPTVRPVAPLNTGADVVIGRAAGTATELEAVVALPAVLVAVTLQDARWWRRPATLGVRRSRRAGNIGPAAQPLISEAGWIIGPGAIVGDIERLADTRSYQRHLWSDAILRRDHRRNTATTLESAGVPPVEFVAVT